MPDLFDVLCRRAQKTVATTYYNDFLQPNAEKRARINPDLSESISTCAHTPLIAEVKVASPTTGLLRKDVNACKIANSMEKGGAAGISIVTEPRFFSGSVSLFESARRGASLPLLMKDFVVSQRQIEAAREVGASAVLLIQALFDRGYASCAVGEMIECAHTAGLEVLLEAHTVREFERAMSTETDLIGINNRDLRTLDVDITTTKKILEKVHRDERRVISESGIATRQDAQFLRQCGADALLVGSKLMRAHDVCETVRLLAGAT